MSDCVRVTTATPTRAAARDLARLVVESRLAAGAQIAGPVESAFWHDGEFGTGEEWTLTMTTTTGCYPALEAKLAERHVWDNPEIIAVPITTGSSACLDWVRRTVVSG